MQQVLNAKFIVLLLSIASLILTGCQKAVVDEDEETVENDKDLVAIQFNIGKIEQISFENATAATRAKALKELCSRINFAIYQNDKKLKGVNQTSDEEGFGTIKLELSPGTYQVLLLANSCSDNPSMAHPEKVTFEKSHITDTFYYYGTIDVDESAQVSINLKRVVAMFRLKFTDAMPENVASIKIAYTGGSSTLDATTGVGCVDSRQNETFTISSDQIGQPATFEVYTFPHADSKKLKVKVTAYDAAGQVIQERTLTDVPVQVNQITVYEGEFFTGSGSEEETSEETTSANSFTITIDDYDWNEETHTF